MLGPSFALCRLPHWANFQVWSRFQLHAGGPSLAPYIQVHCVQGSCLGLALISGVPGVTFAS